MFYEKTDLLEEAATLERYKYSPLGQKLKAQTDILTKQHQKLDDAFKFDEKLKTKNQHIVFTNIIVMVKNLITFVLNQSILFQLNFFKI